MNWSSMESFIGGALGATIGDSLLAGLLILFFFAGLTIRLGLSFDAAVVILSPVVWVVASPVNIGGAGFLPAWVFYMMLFVQAGIAFLGLMRVFNR